MIVGLDLSLTGLGMAAVPPDWDLDWKHVQTHRVSCPLPRNATLRQQTDRLRSLALDCRVFAVRVGATHVWGEDLPTARAFNLVSLGELRGAVRLELLRECGLDLHFAPQSSVRKFLLGRLPRKDRKAHVVEALKAAGANFGSDDECDAFAVANWGLSEIGAPCMAGLLWTSGTAA